MCGGTKKNDKRTMGDVIVCRDAAACCKRMGWTSYKNWISGYRTR
jgi:hypothetical protein